MLTHKSLNLNYISMFVLVFGIAISASFINTAQGSEQKKHDHSEVFIWEWNLELEKVKFEAEETIECLSGDRLEAFIWEWEREGLS